MLQMEYNGIVPPGFEKLAQQYPETVLYVKTEELSLINREYRKSDELA